MMGGQIGSLLQMLMQQNPQAFQQIVQMMQQRQQGVGGIGSLGLSPRGDNSMIGGPMPYSGGPIMGSGQGADGTSSLDMVVRQGGPRSLLPPGTMGGSTLDSYPRMGAPTQSPPPSQWVGSGIRGFQGTGPTLPFQQRFNMTPNAPAQAMMPTSYDGGRTFDMQGGTVNRPPAPYRPPAYTPAPAPAPFSPPSQPKTYAAPGPAGPSLAQNGAAGLDWYAMQAGN